MSIAVKDNYKALLDMPLDELISLAGSVRKKHIGSRLELCGIFNARCGLCGEDCKFCAQSSRYNTAINAYPMKGVSEIVRAAESAKAMGVGRFGIVTSGNRLDGEEIERVVQVVHTIKNKVGIGICGSLGALDLDQLRRLKRAGMTRYHHNIETSRNFYPKIVTTHSFDERISTIAAAKDAGMEVCSGGIIGMGETWQDRIDMARTLKDLKVDSVPLNVLIPIKGTPLGQINAISPDDVLRTIAVFRIILEDKTIKMAAGREAVLEDRQLTGFLAGANGMIIGGYLTVKGAELEDDYDLIEKIRRAWAS